MDKHIKLFLNRKIPYQDGASTKIWSPSSIHFKNLKNATILKSPTNEEYGVDLFTNLIKERDTTLYSVLEKMILKQHYPMNNVIIYTIEDKDLIPVFRHFYYYKDHAFVFYFILHKLKNSKDAWEKVYMKSTSVRIKNEELMFKQRDGSAIHIFEHLPDVPGIEKTLLHFSADIIPLVFLYLSKELNTEITRESTPVNPGYKGDIYKTLIIDPSAEQVEDILHYARTGIKKRFHSVRGHERKYKTGKTIFIDSHNRGDKSIGIVHKEYKIKLLDRIKAFFQRA